VNKYWDNRRIAGLKLTVFFNATYLVTYLKCLTFITSCNISMAVGLIADLRMERIGVRPPLSLSAPLFSRLRHSPRIHCHAVKNSPGKFVFAEGGGLVVPRRRGVRKRATLVLISVCSPKRLHLLSKTSWAVVLLHNFLYFTHSLPFNCIFISNGKSHCCNGTITDVVLTLLPAKDI